MIGITGTIGSGKSLAGQLLKDMGFKVIDADTAVHELYKNHKILRKKIAFEFGENYLTKDGINRTLMADLIFKNSKSRIKLEHLVYPILTEFLTIQSPQFIEAALLENLPEIKKKLKEVWVIIAQKEVRLNRLVLNRGLTLEDANRRIELQKNRDSKTFLECTYKNIPLKFLDNSKDEFFFKEQIINLLK